MRFSVQPGDCAPFHEGYVRLMQDRDIVEVLHEQRTTFAAIIAAISEEQGNTTYAPGKWTIKELIQHVIDSERIFAFRLLAISRGEQQPIPGFEQEEYAAAIDVSRRKPGDQHAEFLTVRDATLSLVHSISPDEAMRKGIVSGHPLTTRAIPFIMAGHLEHHIRILKDRYRLD